MHFTIAMQGRVWETIAALFLLRMAMKNATATLRAKAKKPRRIAVDLFERMDLSESRVDREKAIIHNVKILGKHSPNKHGMPGVEGTDYLPSAHAQAREQYEGMEVNVGHPPKNDPDAERDPRDRNGVLLNTRIKDNETYGDWHLIPSHPMTPTFLDCASDPRLHSQFAMSHNAKGFGSVRENRYQIGEIPLVRSVDVVTRGGVNRTLFESQEPPMKKKFKDVLETASGKVQMWFADILEADETLGEMPVGPPAPAEAGEKPGHLEHLGELLKAIIVDEALSADEKCDKIMAAIKVMEEKKKEVPESEEEDKPKQDKEGEEFEDDKAKEDTKKDVKEGAEKSAAKHHDKMESREAIELSALRNREKARDLCESLEFVPTQLQLKAITGMPSDPERKLLIKDYKALASPARKGTQPHTATGRNVLESRTKPVTDKKAFAESILS